MVFPSDVKDCMKDCILAIIWPKEKIYIFFKDNGCTTDDLELIKNYKAEDNKLSRAAMIDLLFNRLSSRHDGGLGQFRSIMEQLVSWEYFNPYYFDKLKKLDRKTAEMQINRLKQLQEIHDVKIKGAKIEREKRQMQIQSTTRQLQEIKNEFFNWFGKNVSPQKRGYALEKILLDLAKLSELETTEAFRANGEQIDGAIKYDGEHYLIEAKWQDKAASNEPVYQFASKVEGKMYGRGIFISINGYSSNVILDLVKGKVIKTLFVDGEDITLVVEGQISFAKMIDRKVREAQTKGNIYVNPISGQPKIRTDRH